MKTTLQQENSTIYSLVASLYDDIKPLTDAELEQIKVNNYNRSEGNSLYYDCPKCKNKEFVAFLNSENTLELRQCDCKPIRLVNSRIEKSGLKQLLFGCTFDTFEATEMWQKNIKNTAEMYLKDYKGNWFYIGGQTSSGKTHICTAIMSEFIKQGKKAAYMLWRDEIVPLKANINNYEEYEKRINQFKKADVLYIDDFFKIEKGVKPTTADINIAYELLNYRYNNPELITILSSEMLIKDLLQVDEAVASRIYEKSKKYQINIEPDIKKNYRLR